MVLSLVGKNGTRYGHENLRGLGNENGEAEVDDKEEITLRLM